jgi:homospermidine synthase
MKTIEHIVIVGFGSIAQGLLPLLLEHYNKVKVTILEKKVNETQEKIAKEFSATLEKKLITVENFKQILSPHLNERSFLLNLAVSVSSIDLIALAQEQKALYLDTCIEPWDYKTDKAQNLASNYELREHLKNYQQNASTSTAIVAHGANPGFISILLKKALLEMASINGINASPESQLEWAELAKKLGIRIVQISERDTQITLKQHDANSFVSTWSVEGLITECLQPAEVGWGSHEKEIPFGAKHNGYMIEMAEQGCRVRVKSWSPNYLEFSAYLLTHNESLSIAEYLTLGAPSKPTYRPTVYYAYEPCNQTLESMHLLISGNKKGITYKEILKEDIVSGIDELGVFLISNKFNSFWLGSNLSIGKSRKMAKYNSATSLQVTSSIVAGMKWAEQHPEAGVIESEQLDWSFIFEFTDKYWQPMVRQETDWRPFSPNDTLLFQNFLTDQ